MADQKIVRTTLENLDEDMRKNGIRKQAMILAGWALDRIFIIKRISFKAL